MSAPARPATTARNIALLLAAALCLEFALWHAARYSAATAVLAGALGVAPWLAVGPGLWRGRPSHYVAAMLLTTPYLCYGLMESIANAGARHWAAALVLTAFALCVALLAYLRVSRPPAAAPT